MPLPVLLVSLLGATPSSVIHVPSDFPTIQLAIQVAFDGDTIVVAPGTYPEAIDFLGKEITVESSGGAAVTIIDATGLRSPVATFEFGESSSSILRGFTLQGGAGFRLFGRRGGNVFIRTSSPLLEHNVIRGNDPAANVKFGGGLYTDLSSVILRNNRFEGCTSTEIGGACCFIGSSPHLEGNTFVDNVAQLSGGAIAFDANGFASAPVLEGNLFETNIALDGGAISGTGGDYIMDANTFLGNRADACGGALCLRTVDSADLRYNHVEGQLGATQFALEFEEVTRLVVEENTLLDNPRGIRLQTANETSTATVRCNEITGAEAGVALEGGSPHIVDNALTGVAGPTGLEAGLFLDRTGATSERNVLRGFGVGLHAIDAPETAAWAHRIEESLTHGVWLQQSAMTLGDTLVWRSGSNAVRCDDSDAHLLRLTVTEGTSVTQGAGLYVRGPRAPRLESSIVWGHTAPLSPSIYDETGRLDVTWSDVEGTYPGLGNLNVDPMFVGAATGDHRLTVGSPCIDLGSPTDSSCLEQDPRRASRSLDGNFDRRRHVDMGAFEFTVANLDVHGTFSPGGVITLEVTGVAGLNAQLLIGLQPTSLCHPWYGGLFVSTRGGLLRNLGSVPTSTTLTLPPTLSVPSDLHLQLLAVEPSSLAGGFSNAVVAPIR